jgi:hypothetical protein
MALYLGGKIRFNDVFIAQFKSEDVQEFLRITRYNLVTRNNSPYCTLEHLLYNKPSFELERELYWYLMGKKNATRKNYIEMSVSSMSESYDLLKKLKEIEQQMKIDNKW